MTAGAGPAPGFGGQLSAAARSRPNSSAIVAAVECAFSPLNISITTHLF